MIWPYGPPPPPHPHIQTHASFKDCDLSCPDSREHMIIRSCGVSLQNDKSLNPGASDPFQPSTGTRCWQWRGHRGVDVGGEGVELAFPMWADVNDKVPSASNREDSAASGHALQEQRRKMIQTEMGSTPPGVSTVTDPLAQVWQTP